MAARLFPGRSRRLRRTATPPRQTTPLLPSLVRRPSPRRRRRRPPYVFYISFDFAPKNFLFFQKKPKKEGEEGAAAAPAEGEAAPADGAAPKKTPRVRKPKAPRPPRPAGEDPVGEQSTTMLFVANLGFNIDDAGLSALFTDAGIAVTSARIVRRRWGQPRKSKGYGFVDVGGEEEQKKAIEALQGKEVGGRAIAVKIAVNTPHDDEDAAEDAAKPAAEAAPAAPAAGAAA